MPILNKFLCCFELEIGGYVCGILGTALSGFGISLIALTIASRYNELEQNGYASCEFSENFDKIKC